MRYLKYLLAMVFLVVVANESMAQCRTCRRVFRSPGYRSVVVERNVGYGSGGATVEGSGEYHRPLRRYGSYGGTTSYGSYGSSGMHGRRVYVHRGYGTRHRVVERVTPRRRVYRETCSGPNCPRPSSVAPEPPKEIPSTPAPEEGAVKIKRMKLVAAPIFIKEAPRPLKIVSSERLVGPRIAMLQ